MLFKNRNSFDDEDNDIQHSDRSSFNLKKYFKYFILLVVFLIAFIMIYATLINKDGEYQEPEEVVDAVTYSLILDGETEITIYQEDKYIEPGYIARDSYGRDVSAEVVITGNLNTNVVGKYLVNYILHDVIMTRKINVIERPKSATDIHLLGDVNIYLNIGERYKEPGYVVTDSVDGDSLNDRVKIINEVDTSKTGVYKVIYSVTNSIGITTTAVRNVIVIDSDMELMLVSNEPTNKTVGINIYITDVYYDYVVLPDGNKTNERNYVYEVSENGVYKFTVYNKQGSSKTKSIEVKNIDRTIPTGSCSGTYTTGKSVITVSASDKNGISKYVIDGNQYTTNKIVIAKEIKTANIEIYDKAGNTKMISCNLTYVAPPTTTTKTTTKTTKKTTTTTTTSPSSSTPVTSGTMEVRSFTSSRNRTMAYWLYVPKSSTKRLPIFMFLHGIGEYGNDYKYGTTNSIYWAIGNDIKKYNANYDSIVLIPQLPSKSASWEEYMNDVLELYEKIIKDYNVNPRKKAIGGFSAGCFGVNHYVTKNQNYFSAAVMISCDGYSAEKFKSTPVWGIAGARESYSSTLKRFINNVNNYGGTGRFNSIAGKDHTGVVGKNGYSVFRDNDLKIMDWVIAQSR